MKMFAQISSWFLNLVAGIYKQAYSTLSAASISESQKDHKDTQRDQVFYEATESKMKMSAQISLVMTLHHH